MTNSNQQLNGFGRHFFSLHGAKLITFRFFHAVFWFCSLENRFKSDFDGTKIVFQNAGKIRIFATHFEDII